MFDDEFVIEQKKDYAGPLRIVFSLLSRGTAEAAETSLFAKLSHEELIEKFRAYLDRHRHFLGYCHIEESHSLNERGVDLLLRTEKAKIGFQIKSHYDVKQKNFADSVKRQLAESSVHKLDHYFILVCAPYQDGAKDHSKRISFLLNELSMMETLNQTAYGPLSTVRFFQGLPPLTRDELIKHKIIDESALHYEEKGYEHMPEIDDNELRKAQKQLDKYGDDWFDSRQGSAAFNRLQQLYYRKKGEQFARDFLSTIPEETRRKREGLVTEILNLLEQSRRCKSWDENSEYKLNRSIEHVPEEMIPYTSLPKLLRVKEGLEAYLDLHRRMDQEMKEQREDEAGNEEFH